VRAVARMPFSSRRPAARSQPSSAAPIRTATPHAARLPLYERLLGASWLELADPIRRAHGPGPRVGAGRLRIVHGSSRVSRVLARLLRLPRASEAADTRLIIAPRADGEQWLRTFGDRRLDSAQYQTGEAEFAERFGLLELRFRLEASAGSLLFRQVEAVVRCGPVRLRLPAGCAPSVTAREDAAGTHGICIHLCVAVPMVGPVLTYDGLVDIESAHE